MGSRKMGRPTNSPKVCDIKVRISEEDYNKLKAIHEATGKYMSEIVRTGIEIQYNNLKK